MSERQICITAEFLDSKYVARRLNKELSKNNQLYTIIDKLYGIEEPESDETSLIIETVTVKDNNVYFTGYTGTSVPPTWVVKPLANLGAKNQIIQEMYDEGLVSHYYVGAKRYTKKRFSEYMSRPDSNGTQVEIKKNDRKKFNATYESHEGFSSVYGQGNTFILVTKSGDKLLYRGSSKKIFELTFLESSKDIEFYAQYEKFTYKKQEYIRVSNLSKIKINKHPLEIIPTIETLEGCWKLFSIDGNETDLSIKWIFYDGEFSEKLGSEKVLWPKFKLENDVIYFRPNKSAKVIYFNEQRLIVDKKGARLELIRE